MPSCVVNGKRHSQAAYLNRSQLGLHLTATRRPSGERRLLLETLCIAAAATTARIALEEEMGESDYGDVGMQQSNMAQKRWMQCGGEVGARHDRATDFFSF